MNKQVPVLLHSSNSKIKSQQKVNLNRNKPCALLSKNFKNIDTKNSTLYNMQER